MAQTLDNLLQDSRLVRLFSEDALDCALQLWVLQIKTAQSIENRVVYGRMLPYNFSNGKWSARYKDNFETVARVEAQLLRVSIYLKSTRCRELLEKLSNGLTISEISRDMDLNLSEHLEMRVGSTALASESLVYRPVAYLLNRDAHDTRSLPSPHPSSDAFSASLVQTDKEALFRVEEGYDALLTSLVVRELNADTGLQFSATDAVRFGDLELLVFPALDDSERQLLNVDWSDTKNSFLAQFNPMQVPKFNNFQFHLSIANDGQIVYSSIANAELDEKNVFKYAFELSDQLRSITDTTELEIFGFDERHSTEGTLCCRWRIGYVREINFQGHMSGHRVNPVKLDWLEKTTRPSESARVKSALTTNRGTLGFNSQTGGRKADPWVPPNRDLISLFSRLHPPKSEGRFFRRWGKGDGEGRLQFVEWFKALLTKYQRHQVIIFDPYFDTAGLDLVLLYAERIADYIVFTSLSKLSTTDKAAQPECGKSKSERLANLIANCKHNRRLIDQIKFRVYGLKDGRLHDRYILVIGNDGLPVAGFNLSNSFQKAAENYPLLVTPIPADVLLDVEQYSSELISEAAAAHVEDGTPNPLMRLLFDSTESSTEPRRYEPHRFLEKAQAGNVLCLWTSEPSLKGLRGEPLKERMRNLNLLDHGSLALDKSGLNNFVSRHPDNFADFADAWDVIGEILAHSHIEESDFYGLEPDSVFIDFLSQFLESSGSREYGEDDREWVTVDVQLFRETLDSLLHSPHHPSHLFHPTKYGSLRWSEYFAIKLLWRCAPNALLTVTEAQIVELDVEPNGKQVMRLSLLSQIVSEISLSTQFDITEGQRSLLVHSSNGLLQWMGVNAIETHLERADGLAVVVRWVASFAYEEQVRVLGWMVHRAAKSTARESIYEQLVAELHKILPEKIAAYELRYLIDAMRGHMWQLAWAEPWIFEDVVFPLLKDERAETDDACKVWVTELTHELEEEPRLFERAREGQMTNVAAFLFAHSSAEQRQASLDLVRTILNRQRRVVQQPLASTSNWKRWNDALVVSMWALTFMRWSQFYLSERDLIDTEVNELSRQAYELSMVRPLDEWRSKGPRNWAELATFLDQVEGLLISSDD